MTLICQYLLKFVVLTDQSFLKKSFPETFSQPVVNKNTRYTSKHVYLYTCIQVYKEHFTLDFIN